MVFKQNGPGVVSGEIMRKGISCFVKVFGFLQSLLSFHIASAWWGKTELELNGIGVIKEAAQILANSINTFPTQSTAISFIGLITFSQGIYLFAKGIVNIMSNAGDAQMHRLGKTQFIVGSALSIVGLFATLYSLKIAKLFFS